MRWLNYARDVAKVKGAPPPQLAGGFSQVPNHILDGYPDHTRNPREERMSAIARYLWGHLNRMDDRQALNRVELADRSGLTVDQVGEGLKELTAAGLVHLFEMPVGRGRAGDEEFVVDDTPSTREAAMEVFQHFRGMPPAGQAVAHVRQPTASPTGTVGNSAMTLILNHGEPTKEEPAPSGTEGCPQVADEDDDPALTSGTGEEGATVPMARVDEYLSSLTYVFVHIAGYRKDLLSESPLPIIPAWWGYFATATAQRLLREIVQRDSGSRKPLLTPKALRAWLVSHWDEVENEPWMDEMQDYLGGLQVLETFQKTAEDWRMELTLIHILQRLQEDYTLGLFDPTALLPPMAVVMAADAWDEVYLAEYPDGALLSSKARLDLALVLLVRFYGDVAALRRAVTKYVKNTQKFLADKKHHLNFFLTQLEEYT